MNRTKILAIDDEKDFLELIKEKLELEDYDVITATDGDEGIEKAYEHKPDLVLLDIKMPKKSGIEVLNTLKKDVNFKAPIVMVTAIGDFDQIKASYENSADFYVTKPVNLEKLLKNIRALLSIQANKVDKPD